MTLDTPALDDAPSVTASINAAAAADSATADAVRVPVSEIHVLEGHNPRRFFADGPFQRLKDSIREHGLVTPLTVRPRDDGGYWLIAGERRLRCVRELAIESVPVLVRDVSEGEARMLAVIENADRADLTLADEVLSIQSLLAAYEGDVESVAASLGWKPERVKHRLKLMQAAPAVIEALAAEQIKLGHVELLATLPQDAQPKVLAKVIESGATVADLKGQLESFAMPLARAIFDRKAAGCATCPFNSSAQRGLFEDASTLAEDKCTNRACYGQHTQSALDAKREAAKDEFATVAYSSQVAPGTSIPLTVVGQGSVTEEQFSSCQGCAQFGVVIEDRVGPNTGTASGPTCFNVACNKTKVAEAVEARRPAPVAVVDAPSTPAPAASPSITPAAAPKPAPKPAPTAAAAATPKAVQVAGDRMQRNAVNSALGQHPSMLLAMAVYGLVRARRSDGDSKITNPLKPFGIDPGHDDTKLLLKLTRLDPAVLKQALLALSQAVVLDHVDSPFVHSGLNRRKVAATLVRDFKIDVAPFVAIDKAYLEAHTKSGIEAVLAESGFAAWFKAKEGDKGDKAYKALLAQGKGDLIKAVLAAGYDWTGYIPSSLKALA
jgi:PRTRC genetic system ParB family protein